MNGVPEHFVNGKARGLCFIAAAFLLNPLSGARIRLRLIGLCRWTTKENNRTLTDAISIGWIG